MSATDPSRSDRSLAGALRRVAALSLVAGYVEIVGYTDVGGIYPGIMTGNTVQLGFALARAQWERFGLIGFAVGLFFVGAIIASLIKRRLRRRPAALLLMAGILICASVVRLYPSLRIPVELPLLALAMAIQGETIARFGGVSLQTIVVTNNMVKFSDGLVARYLPGPAERPPQGKPPELKQVLMPGVAWLSYSIGSGAGAVRLSFFQIPLIIPAVILPFVVTDLLAADRAGAEVARE
jgi:uncharacterized membrane protein YoaK (UPF0700 family)